MACALVPGSFDPVTNGHLDIVERAAKMFDAVIVAVARNSSKSPLFSTEERLEMLEEACAEWPNVTIASFEGLLVEYAFQSGATVIVKGLRAVSDFEYELQMALMNRRLNSAVETMFMMTGAEYSYLSSSIVKEIARLGGAVEGLVPPNVEKRLRHKVKNPQPELDQNAVVRSEETAKTAPDTPRFVAPTHEGVDILKLLSELEDLVENTAHGPFGTLFRFNEDAFHMTIMKIRANLPEEMKRASKLARESERLAEETRDNADRVIGDARQAARAELERGRAEVAQSRLQAQEEARRLQEEAQANARRLQDEAQGDIQRVRAVAEREAQRLVHEAREESARIVAVAQEQAVQAVAESEILRQAQAQGQELQLHAAQEAEAIRRGADEYARDVLGNLETVLGKAITQIQRGRDMLDR